MTNKDKKKETTMTAEERRKMLVRVLSAQLPYGLIVHIDGLIDSKLTGVYDDRVSTERGINHPIQRVEPYLRPMESMTEKERKVYKEISSHLCDEIPAKTLIDWLDENHFDYRGLIPMGLALEAPKKMYARGLDDEEIRQALIENFKFYCGDELKNSRWGKDDDLLVTDIIAWLEKQREETWKPSEEQLRVLQAHLEDGAVVWGDNRKVLKSLYEDLMRLERGC